MAWFRNHYSCDACDTAWTDEWSCMCDDECGGCGVDYSPDESDDLSFVVRRSKDDDGFVVLRSGDDADDRPRYARFAGPFPTREEAEARARAEMEGTRAEMHPALAEHVR